jgi:16S rRNA G966 N2-methylase RsmD
MINILSSVLHLCRLTDLGSQSQFPYWVPKKDILERNILLLILKKINEIAKHKKTNTLNLKLIKNFNQINKSEKNIIIINKPSQLVNEEEIPVKSIDLVITDPPYFDQVAYSEYLKIWEYFCDYKSNFKDEIILSNRKYEPSSEEKYIENLTKCFSVVSRKMKDDGLAIIFFKDSKPKNIHLFLKVMEESGLQFLRSIHVGNKNFTYKQNTTQETTVTGECLFFFIKNTTIKNIKNKKIVFDRLLIKEKIEEVVKDFTFEYLRKNKNGTLGELYDNGLLLTLYNNDLLQEINKSKDIVDILNKNFILFEDRNYRIE